MALLYLLHCFLFMLTVKQLKTYVRFIVKQKKTVAGQKAAFYSMLICIVKERARID